MAGLYFPPASRIQTKRDYAGVFSANKKKYVVANWLKMVYLPNPFEQARLGIIVSKKWSKSAVKRNLVKRIIREHFRVTHSQLPHWDIIVMVKPNLTAQQRKQLGDRRYAIKATLKQDMVKLWKKINIT